jgi:hypothetical protein
LADGAKYFARRTALNSVGWSPPRRYTPNSCFGVAKLLGYAVP